MKKLILVAGLLAFGNAQAGFEIKELGLNGPGYGTNLKVIPMDLKLELGKHKFSYDADEINFNHQYAGAKHVIDRLSFPERAKIELFVHNAIIEKKLAPHTIPVGEVTLDTILSKSPYDTTLVKNEKDLDVFIKQAYHDKLNAMVTVKTVKKRGNIFEMEVQNNADFRISKIRGKLKVSEIKNNRVIMDEYVTESGMFVGTGVKSNLTLNMPSRLEGWVYMNEGLNSKFTVQEVEFFNGLKFNTTQFFDEIKSEIKTLDPHPFNEI